MRTRVGVAACLLVATWLLTATAPAVTTYTIRDLDIEVHYMRPGTLNDSGQVVSTSVRHAVLWDDGVITDLGTLGGDRSDAYGINDLGQVVGSADVQAPAVGDRAFLWLPAPAYGLPAGMNDLGTLGGDTSTARAINDNGQVVGSGTTWSGVYRAFLWEAGVMTDIGSSIPYQSFALGINNIGQVVGHSYVPDGEAWTNRAFLWDPDDGVTDLGAGFGVAVNNLDQVAGYGGGKAFIWQDGVRTDLGTLGGTGQWAGDINNASQIVGAAATATTPPGEAHAFIWEDGVMHDLNDLIPAASGWELLGASAINERGWVFGWGICDGDERAFLLTPIPEPGAFLLAALGMLALALVKKIRG